MAALNMSPYNLRSVVWRFEVRGYINILRRFLLKSGVRDRKKLHRYSCEQFNR